MVVGNKVPNTFQQQDDLGTEVAVVGAVSSIDQTAYVADLIAELMNMAHGQGMSRLAGLLELAHVEAQEQILLLAQLRLQGDTE